MRKFAENLSRKSKIVLPNILTSARGPNESEQSERGTFRVRGEVIEIIPAASEKRGVRVEFFGDEIERISEIDMVTGKVLRLMNHVLIFPASHYATSKDKLDRCIEQIEADLALRLKDFRDNDRLLEAQRLEQRVHCSSCISRSK